VFNESSPDSAGRVVTTDQLARAIAAANYSPLGPVSDSMALSSAAVFACVRLLSQAVATLPVNLYKRKNRKLVLQAEHPVNKLVSLRPSPWQTSFEFWQMVVVHLLLRGNFYAQKVVSGSEIIALLWLDPDKMEVKRDENGGLRYEYHRIAGQKIDFKPAELLHIRALCADGMKGLSAIQAARNSIQSAVRAEEHGAQMFANGARPTGVLYQEGELTEEAFQRIRKDFETNFCGTHNSGRPLILESGLKWQQLSMTAEDAQFIDQRKFSRSEIAMFLGVPPHMIGDIERGTSWGSGIEQQNLGFLVYTLLPYLINIQQAVIRDLLPLKDQPSFVLKFDTSLLTRADFVARQNGLKTMRDSGVISKNEWREIEGYDPIEDGDSYEVTANPSPSSAAPEGRQAAN
jgi:HK97 family phage portal protein